jgi:hypothetical protein
VLDVLFFCGLWLLWDFGEVLLEFDRGALVRLWFFLVRAFFGLL